MFQKMTYMVPLLFQVTYTIAEFRMLEPGFPVLRLKYCAVPEIMTCVEICFCKLQGVALFKIVFYIQAGIYHFIALAPRLISAQCWARIRVHIFFLARLK